MNRILLVGNPNCGKTTLFNRLTGKSARVGNWHGVTVNSITAPARGRKYAVTDTPGIYSLDSFSGEEAAAFEEIARAGADTVVINVIEAVNLRRSLRLTRQLAKRGIKCAVVVNMYGELTARGGSIDKQRLEGILGCPVLIADKKTGVEDISSLAGRATEIKPFDALADGVFIPPDSYAKNPLDKVMLRPALALPALAVIFLAVMYLTFGKYGLGAFCGTFLKNCIEQRLSPAVENALYCNRFLQRLTVEGVIGGLSGVVSFIPQLAVIFLCLIILEESGILARAALVTDGALKKIGVSGKAVFSLLTGFGCTATAVAVSKGIESAGVKRRTVMMLHFIPCSARLPVIYGVAGCFFKGREAVIVALLYAVGIVMGSAFSLIHSRMEGAKPEPLVFELPPYRIPRPIAVLKQLKYYLISFIIKTGTLLFCVCVGVWLLRSFSPSLVLLEEGEISQSILARIGDAVSFIFRPMGFSGWQMPVAALCGFVAKEGVLSALSLVYPVGLAGEVTAPSALAMLVFVAYYTPCVTCVSTVRCELGRRLSAFYATFSFLVALLCGYLTRLICLAWGVAPALGVMSVFATALAVYALGRLIVKINFKEIFNDKIHCPCEGKACKAGCRAGRASLFCSKEAAPRKGYKAERKKGKYRFNLRKRGLN